MIATTSSGRRFGVLARYLMNGRDGTDTDRVAWTVGRNLGTDDPELAAALMQATANGNARVEVPVYHLTVSFDPADPVSPERMQQVADRVLAELGLSDHQTLMVAHGDRAHPHVHCMVNRVHPETERAWERWQDRPQIERTLRELERELGLREVAGRLYQLEGQTPPERARLTSGERRQAERTGELAFPDRVREHLDELRAARSWGELTEILTENGLRLERKGQGLVITDGEHQVKASRVARELSLGRLEERFGVPCPCRATDIGPPTPRVEHLRSLVQDYERGAELGRLEMQVEQVLDRQRADRYRVADAIEGVQKTEERFNQSLARVYRDPTAARAQVDAAAATLGAERVRALLADEPERFGGLRTTEERRAWGLVLVDDDRAARGAAPGAAFQWERLGEIHAHATAVVREFAPDHADPGSRLSLDHAREQLAEQIRTSEDTRHRILEVRRGEPSRELLQRAIGLTVGRLEPDELRQVRMLFTAPQAAIAFHVRQTLREIALGRDERER